MAFFDFIKPLNIKAPEITYFDHLVGEFESIEAALAGEATGPAKKPAAPAAPPPGGAARTPTQDEKAAGQAGEAAGQVKDAARQAKADATAGAATPQAKDAAQAETAASDKQSADAARGILREAKEKVAALKAKRGDETLDWNDLYKLERLLAEVRPIGALRGKVLSLRHDYRSVAGQVEYDEYLASKPKNLLDPPDPRNPPDANADYELLLRDDMKDLLDRLFKRYAFLPVREERMKRLTIWAALFCGLFLVILIIFILSMDRRPVDQSAAANPNASREAQGGAQGNSNDNRAGADSAQAAAGDAENRRPLFPSIALFVVLVSGAMGGFVSALQRIQSSPTEGDSVYNLSMLYHGSYAVFVAPLTGAVFAILLYFMFTGKILEGRFFPNIYTPAATIATPTPTPSPSPATQPNAPAGESTANKPANANRTPAPTRPAGTTTPAPAANSNASTAANVNANTNAGNTNSVNTNAGNVNVGNTNTGGTRNANAVNANANTGGKTMPETEAPTAKPTPPQVATASLRVKEFLYESGPAGGEDYALLIIWSFIAGFAERFVPDSLNRLVAGKQAGGQSGT
jgi:hypothetical protein